MSDLVKTIASLRHSPSLLNQMVGVGTWESGFLTNSPRIGQVLETFIQDLTLHWKKKDETSHRGCVRQRAGSSFLDA